MDNRREFPRTTLDLARSMSIQDTKQVMLFDVSKGGASFLSDTSYEPGTLITAGTGMLTINVKVLECEVVEVDSGMMEYKYKVRCKYETQDDFEAETFFEMIIQ